MHWIRKPKVNSTENTERRKCGEKLQRITNIASTEMKGRKFVLVAVKNNETHIDVIGTVTEHFFLFHLFTFDCKLIEFACVSILIENYQFLLHRYICLADNIPWMFGRYNWVHGIWRRKFATKIVNCAFLNFLLLFGYFEKNNKW